jgi:membrane protease subunit HflK
MGSIFGGGGGKRSGGGQRKPMKIGFIMLLGIVLIAGWAVMGIYTVNEQERVVILRLGKYNSTVLPGLRWNPLFIDERYSLNVTRVQSKDHRALMLTEDENIVDVALKVQYRISDPKKYVLQVRDPVTSLGHATDSALRHVVGTSEMHFILTEGRANMGAEVQERLQNLMAFYGTGLLISKVNIESTAAPTQVQAAFDDVIKAREDEQRVVNEAESYANGIVPEARGASQRILEEANAYREEVVAKAVGEANRFNQLLSEYQKAPEVTRERMYLDAVELVMSSSTKVLMDVKGGNNIMYLPLDKIVGDSGSSRGFSSSSSGRFLDDASVQDVADEVIERLRRRQNFTKKER